MGEAANDPNTDTEGYVGRIDDASERGEDGGEEDEVEAAEDGTDGVRTDDKKERLKRA